MTSVPPQSIPPELKAELIHYFAEADRKNAARFDAVLEEVRAEREKRQRESQRLTALETWRDEVSVDIKAMSRESAETKTAVTGMSAGVDKLTGAVEKLVATNTEQDTAIFRLKLTVKMLGYLIVFGGSAGGVAKAISMLFG